jgi:hypothetical protein
MFTNFYGGCMMREVPAMRAFFRLFVEKEFYGCPGCTKNQGTEQERKNQPA